MKETKVTIKIPRPLYRRIKVLIEDSGFDSPTDFIVFVLRDLVGGRGAAAPRAGAALPQAIAAGRETEESGDLTPEELQAIRKRLENLGYL